MATHQAALTIEAEAGRRVRSKRGRPRAIEKRTAWAFVLPLVLVELALVAAPMALGAFYSLYRVDYFELTQFRGLGNYWTVLTSPMVRDALGATVVFSLFSLVFTIGLGMALAMRLEADSRTNVWLRAIVLIPYIISMLVGSLLLRWIYSSDSGLPGMVLGPFGLGDASVLANPASAMAALVSNAMWRDSAFAMIILLAGLKAIPAQLYAAARVDGAGVWTASTDHPAADAAVAPDRSRAPAHPLRERADLRADPHRRRPNKATQTTGLAMYRLGFVEFRIGEANALAILVFSSTSS